MEASMTIGHTGGQGVSLKVLATEQTASERIASE
jgi:hypothetical protein